MRNIIIIFLSLFTSTGFAQISGGNTYRVQLTDVQGLPIEVKSESNIEGSVFISDEYQPGRLTIRGKTYSNLKLKLNIEKNLVYFEKDGVVMVPSGVVNMVEFLDPLTGKYNQVFRNGFPSVDKNTSQTFYQVLDSGNALLLKHVGLNLRESQAYGESAVTKKYEQVKSYYVFVNNKLVPVKKSESIYEALDDKKNEISAYMLKNKTKVNKEQDLISIISYYNHL